jgi:hypothetical protein
MVKATSLAGDYGSKDWRFLAFGIIGRVELPFLGLELLRN